MKHTRPLRRLVAIIATLFVVYSIVGFLVVPPIARSQLQTRLSTLLGRRVTVEKVRVNPYVFSVALENFAIAERDGTTPFLGWQRLYVRFDALASVWGEWVLGDIALDGFHVRAVLNRDQSLNFSDILAKVIPPAAPPSPPGRPLRIGRLAVQGARIDFSDLSRVKPFASTIGPLTFTLDGFTTRPQVGAPYRFEAVTESGERLAWSGQIQAEPLESSGTIELANINLPKYAPYYADRLLADIASGQLSVRGRYSVALANGQPTLQLSDGAVQLRNFQLRERGVAQDAVDLPSLDITGIKADAVARNVAIGSIVVTGGRVQVRRDRDGSINLLALVPPSAGPAAAPAAPPPVLTLDTLAVKDFKIAVADLAGPRPARLGLDGLDLSVQHFTLAGGAPMPFSLAFNWEPHGSVKLDGQVGFAPIRADLAVAVDGLAILPLSPLLEQFVNARITGGAVTSKLAVRAAQPANGPLDLAVSGDVRVDRFGLVDGVRNEELAGFDALTLSGLHAGTAPALSVSLERIAVAGPYARVVANPDKSLNLTAVLGGKPAGPAPTAPALGLPPTKPAAAGPPLPQIDIGQVSITGGDFRFTDRSLEPNVAMAVNGFGGTITGLSSRNPAKASVDLKAMVDGSGPITIAGKLDPLAAKKSVDLTVDFRNVDLLPLSPYCGKYAGYDLARGKLRLAVQARLDDTRIDASNVLTLSQFTFGDAVASPDATGLPVRLGVALLKDLNGNIVIDIPVQGTTDDPNFRIGKVVLRVVVNLLTKAAVSPFSLIGSMFGGGGDELAYQEFAPGSSELSPAEQPKLVVLTKALTNRPGLSLGLEGDYDNAADVYALKRQKLDDQVRRRLWAERRVADPNIAPPEKLLVSADDQAAIIKQMFDEKFPPGTQFGTPLPPPPAVVAPPPPPAGLLRRLWAALTLQAARDRRAVRQENAQRARAYAQQMAAVTAAGLPLDQMTGRLAEAIAVTPDDLRALAAARARRVRTYLVDTGKIAGDRLFLVQSTGATKPDKGPRVFLALQ